MSSGASMDVFIWFCLENIFEVMNIINRVLFCLVRIFTQFVYVFSTRDYRYSTGDDEITFRTEIMQLKMILYSSLTLNIVQRLSNRLQELLKKILLQIRAHQVKYQSMEYNSGTKPASLKKCSRKENSGKRTQNFVLSVVLGLTTYYG